MEIGRYFATTFDRIRDVFNRHHITSTESYNYFYSMFPHDPNTSLLIFDRGNDMIPFSIMKGATKFIAEECDTNKGTFFEPVTQRVFEVNCPSDIDKIEFSFFNEHNDVLPYGRIIFSFVHFNTRYPKMNLYVEDSVEQFNVDELNIIQNAVWVLMCRFIATVLSENYNTTIQNSNPKYGRWM